MAKTSTGYYAKLFKPESDENIPTNWDDLCNDVVSGHLIGKKAKASVIEVGNNEGAFQWGLTKFGAEAYEKYEDYSLSAGVSGYMARYEGDVHIPLPFTKYELIAGGDVALGTLGLEASIGRKTEVFAGFGPAGLGVSLALK